MTKAQLAAQHAYEAARPISIWSTTEAQMESWCAGRDAAIAAAARAPVRTTAPVHTPADAVAEARAAAVAEARAETAEIGRLLQEAGMPDLFPSLIGASPTEARAAIAARIWDDAWRRVDGGARSSAPATKPENAQLWAAAFDKAAAARLAASPSPSPTTGTTAPDAGSAAIWDAAYRSIPSR